MIDLWYFRQDEELVAVMVERVGGMTFKDGSLASAFDAEAELQKRGGLDGMLKQSLKNNALLGHLAKRQASQERQDRKR